MASDQTGAATPNILRRSCALYGQKDQTQIIDGRFGASCLDDERLPNEIGMTS